jgi:tetratricopeptide (TPR) repeat protein
MIPFRHQYTRSGVAMKMVACLLLFLGSAGLSAQPVGSYGDDRSAAVVSAAMEMVDSNPDSAISLASSILPILRYGQKELKGLCHLVRGDAYYNKNDFQTAKIDYILSLSFMKELNDGPRLATLYNNLGLVYYVSAQYDSAMVNFLLSLKIESAKQNQEGIAKSYQNIGLVHYQMGDFEKFHNYMKMALALYERLNDKLRMAEAANNLAIALVERGDYINAFSYYQKAYKSFEEYGDRLNMANVLNNLGNLLFYQKKYDESEAYLLKALTIFQDLGNIQGMIHAHTRLGDVYGKKFQSSKAMVHYLVCEELNNSVYMKDLQMQNLKSLAEAYKDMEDYESALRVTEQFYALKDSALNNEKLKVILDIENQYELEKQQSELEKIQEKRRLVGLSAIALVLFILLLAGFVYLWMRHLRAREKQRLVMLEYKVLRNQLNPHFLFSALSTIQYYVLENKMVEAIEYLGDFSQLIRMVLQYSQEEYITLENEKRILETYLNLQVRRYEGRFTYLLHIDESIDTSKVLIPPMLAQPFIENAIELGNLNGGGEGSIWISFSFGVNQLKYRLQDNGVGMIPELTHGKRVADHHSMAIMITHERLRLINQGEPRRPVQFETMDLTKYGKTGQLVEFSVPLHKLP